MSTTVKTYTGYSIGCAVVWAVILAVAATAASTAPKHTIYLIGGGWAIGWLSQIVARSIYPPPRTRQRCTGRST